MQSRTLNSWKSFFTSLKNLAWTMIQPLRMLCHSGLSLIHRLLTSHQSAVLHSESESESDEEQPSLQEEKKCVGHHYQKNVADAFASLDGANIPQTDWVNTVIADEKHNAQQMANIFVSSAKSLGPHHEKLAIFIASTTSQFSKNANYYLRLNKIVNSLILLQEAETPMMSEILDSFTRNSNNIYLSSSTEIVRGLRYLYEHGILTKETIDSILQGPTLHVHISTVLATLQQKRLSLIKHAILVQWAVRSGFNFNFIVKTFQEGDELENKQTLEDAQDAINESTVNLPTDITNLIFSFFHPDFTIMNAALFIKLHNNYNAHEIAKKHKNAYGFQGISMITKREEKLQQDALKAAIIRASTVQIADKVEKAFNFLVQNKILTHDNQAAIERAGEFAEETARAIFILYQKQLLNRHTRTAVVRAGKDGEIAATKLVDAAKLEKKYSPCLFMQSADSSEEIKQAPNQYANLVRALRLHGG